MPKQLVRSRSVEAEVTSTSPQGVVSKSRFPTSALTIVATSTPIYGDYVTPTHFSALTCVPFRGYVDESKSFPWGGSQIVQGPLIKTFNSVIFDDKKGFIDYKYQSGEPYPHVGIPNQQYFDPALSKAMEKVANVNFDALTALAETRGTANTIVSLAETALHALRAVKKLDFKTLRKLSKKASRRSDLPPSIRRKARSSAYKSTKRIKTPAEAWLTYRYGIMPLVYDAQSVVSLLTEPQVREVRYAAKGSNLIDLNTESVSGPPYRRITKSATGTCTCRVVVYCTVKSPLWATASEFGISSPFNTAWEIVPFSFVVDWFLPVGQWLRGLSALPNVKIDTLSMSAQYSTIVSETIVSSSYGTRVEHTGSAVEAYARAPTTIWVPLPRFKNPLKGLVGVKRVIDVLSLISVLRK